MLDERKRTMVAAGLADSVDDLHWVTEGHFGPHRKCDLGAPRPPGTMVFAAELTAERGYPSCDGLLFRWWEGDSPAQACDSEEEGCACDDDVDIRKVGPCPTRGDVWEITFK